MFRPSSRNGSATLYALRLVATILVFCLQSSLLSAVEEQTDKIKSETDVTGVGPTPTDRSSSSSTQDGATPSHNEQEAPDFLQRKFKSMNYSQIWKFAQDLATRYPKLVSLNTAEDLLGLKTEVEWNMCDGEKRCKIPIIHVANKKTLRPETPEIFINGALHGDERMGPVVAIELVAYLCTQYSQLDQIQYIVDNRSVFVMPFANAWGYAQNKRLEYNVDPNRDFPYAVDPDSCMKSLAARAINELFRRHLFRLSLALHGGARTIGYEWGAFKHSSTLSEGGLYDKHMYRSRESPDMAAQTSIATVMQEAAGKEPISGKPKWFYPFGDMSYEVYPVDGGMEDWAYGGSWDPAISDQAGCTPTDAELYPSSRSKYIGSTLRSSTFLVEMDHKKDPPESTYGTTLELTKMGLKDGHISRNLRMTFAMIEMAQPSILFTRKPARRSTPNASAKVDFYGVGCEKLSGAKFVIRKGLCPVLADGDGLQTPSDQETQRPYYEIRGIKRLYSDFFSEDIEQTFDSEKDFLECRLLGPWSSTNKVSGKENSHSMVVTLPKQPGEYCGILLARFDEAWGKQKEPDPKLPPQSHVSRIRLEEYEAKSQEGNQCVVGRRDWPFPSPSFWRDEETTPLIPWASPVGISLSVGSSPRNGHAVLSLSHSNAKPACALLVWIEELATSESLNVNPYTGRLVPVEAAPSENEHKPRMGELTGLTLQFLVNDEKKKPPPEMQGYYVLKILHHTAVALDAANAADLPDPKSESEILYAFSTKREGELPLDGNSQYAARSPSSYQIVSQAETRLYDPFNYFLGRILVVEQYADEVESRGGGKILSSSKAIVGSNQMSSVFEAAHVYMGDHFKDSVPKEKPRSSGSALYCSLEGPSGTKGTEQPNGLGHLIFEMRQKFEKQDASLSEAWGVVHLSGTLCPHGSAAPSGVSIKSDHDCFAPLLLENKKSKVFRTFGQSFVPVDVYLNASSCFCGPGSRLKVHASGVEYTCSLSYRPIYGAESLKNCNKEPSLLPIFSTSFTLGEKLILAFISFVALLLMATPCCVKLFGSRGYDELAH